MKPKRRQAREARAAYRAKNAKTHAKKPRQRRSSAKHKDEIIIPWEQRIAPTDEQAKEWDAWLNEHEPEFEKKYPGRYLAIWDRQIIAATRDGNQIYRLARKARPEVIPLITYVPREEDMLIIPSNFPAEWIEK